MVARSPHLPLDLVKTKLRISTPYRDLIPRSHLIEAAHECPLVVLVADAGYGKTSFLYQLSRAAERIVWYTLDERDNDPAIFAQHLLTAANHEEPVSISWTPYEVSESSRLAERLVGDVLSRIDVSSIPTLLVLDDYHAVMDAPTIDHTVAGLLRDRPANLQIAIASRRPLPIPMARLKAQGLVVTFGPDDLRFGQHDLRGIFGPDMLTDQEIEQVLQMTGGWPAAVQLLRDSLDHTPAGFVSLKARSSLPRPAEIDSFLAEEVLTGLEPDELATLRQVSVVDAVDDGLCVALTGNNTAQVILNSLARRYSFMTVLGGETGEPLHYRVHPLVREVLYEQLPVEEQRRLMTKAGDYFKSHGRATEAARAFIDLRDHERLADLIREEGNRLLTHGRSRTLVEWFFHLPVGTLDRDGELLALHAQLEVELGRFTEAVTEFERSIDLLSESGGDGRMVETLRRLAGLHERRGMYEAARQALARSVTLLPENDPLLAISVQNQLATVQLYGGQPDEALALIVEVVHRCQALGRPDREAVALHNLGHAHDLLGHFDAARDAYTRALTIKRDLGLWGSAALTLNSLGVLDLREGRLSGSEAQLDEAIALSEEHDVPFVLSYALSNLGDLYRDRGDLASASSAYERSLEIKERMGNPFAIAHTWNSLAEFWRRQGDLEQAREYSLRALSLRQEDAGVVEQLLYREERGQISLAMTEYAQAGDDFRTAAAGFQRLGARFHWARVAWFAGYVSWLESGGVPSDIKEVLEVTDEAGYDALIDRLVTETPAFAMAVWAQYPDSKRFNARLARQSDTMLPHITPSFQEMAQENGAQLVGLLARMPGNEPIHLLASMSARAEPSIATPATEMLEHLTRIPAPPLRIEGFGGLRIYRRERLIPDRAWTRRRALDLLALLLMAGPNGRSRDELISMCWPDSFQEPGVAQFHTHVRALRMTLEPESVRGGASRYIVSEGRTYRLVFEHVEWWDLTEFERGLEVARSLDRQGDLPRAASGYAGALDLYRGTLFEGLAPDTEWLDRARERYERTAIDAASRLGTIQEESQDLTSALDSWSRVVDLDPCREDAHRALMRLHAALGRRDRALAQFRYCATILRRELDVDPHPETIALYRRIRGDLSG